MDFSTLTCDRHASHAPRASENFPAFILGKVRTFIPNPGKNFHYKYWPSSFRISRLELWQFERKATLELKESFYLLLNFLGYFILSLVICF